MSADLTDSAVPESVLRNLTASAPSSSAPGTRSLITDVGPVPGAADPLEAWTAVLDSLEAAIDDAVAGDPAANLDDAALEHTSVLAGWTPPPADLGPIPAELVERALRINERQQDAATQLTGELRTLRQHRSVLGSVQTATAPQQTSVYLDVTG